MLHYAHVPRSIDIDEILAGQRFRDISGFNRDYLLYILGLIGELPVKYKDDIDEDGYVLINAALLRKWIGRHYNRYIRLLIEALVIESDNHYITGEKSKGYRYTEQCSAEMKEMLLTNSVLLDKLDRYYRAYGVDETEVTNALSGIVIPPSVIAAYQPAKYWYDAGIISIDRHLAEAYARSVYEFKRFDRRRWDTFMLHDGSVRYKHPLTQYRNAQVSIAKIAGGRFNHHFDHNVYRFHSAITHCKSELRNAITIGGADVVAVDLSNSQPTLLTLLLNHRFWTATEGFCAANIPYLGIQDMFNDEANFTLFINMCRDAQHNEYKKAELDRFVGMVATGTFYQNFRLRLEEAGAGRFENDKAVKPELFTVLFTSNRYLHQPAAASKRVFREWFPNVYELSAAIKAKDPANLPILLQRIESYVMFHKIVARIARERPDLPLIPIHDSIATVKGEEDYIKRVMSEELTLCLGFAPHFKYDAWEAAKLVTEIDRLQEQRVAVVTR